MGVISIGHVYKTIILFVACVKVDAAQYGVIRFALARNADKLHAFYAARHAPRFIGGERCASVTVRATNPRQPRCLAIVSDLPTQYAKHVFAVLARYPHGLIVWRLTDFVNKKRCQLFSVRDR